MATTYTVDSNPAVFITAPNQMAVREVPVPEIGEHDVLIKMGSVGLCGSDFKYWIYNKCGRFTMDSPMVIGHEGSGTVVALGSAVKSLRLGDRVAIEPGIPCRHCSLCHSGRYNLCTRMQFCATPPVDGFLCKLFKHPEDFCFKLPSNVTLDQGAMIEPLAVAVYACERGAVTLGSNILICGAGPVGLLVLMAAKVMGADQVIITDISPHRLALAKKLGADHVINMTEMPKSMEECGTFIQTLASVDAAIECSGVDSSVSLGIHSTRPGGSVVLVGRGSMEPNVPLVKAATFEIDIKGVFRYANCYPRAIAMVAKGQIKPELLISHRFEFIQSEAAFQTAIDPRSSAVKVIINC